jgi:L-lactate dehydrogenase (cytochrome)
VLTIFAVIQDELETAMQMVGITHLSQASPALLNTSELDPYVYRGDSHPWARKIVRNQLRAKL